MGQQKICGCKRYNVHRKWKVKKGDLIKVYSFGKWLDEEQHIHFTSLQSLQIQKIM
ncbi:hypothetical protein ACQKFK_29600 [Bacillus mycoides]|uniref:hypothetical protein n=1 Tax=Bacillus mycoides TaxID=1405 RepID=UPI003CFD5B7C